MLSFSLKREFDETNFIGGHHKACTVNIKAKIHKYLLGKGLSFFTNFITDTNFFPFKHIGQNSKVNYGRHKYSREK